MKVIFEQYGDIIIIGAVILALLALVGLLLATNGPVHNAFVGMINSLLGKTSVESGITGTILMH